MSVSSRCFLQWPCEQPSLIHAERTNTHTHTHTHTPSSPRNQADLDTIQAYCTGYASTAFNSQYVVPNVVAPFDYETGEVRFSNASSSSYNNGTHIDTIANIENPCYKKSPKQELYCQLGSQMSLLVRLHWPARTHVLTRACTCTSNHHTTCTYMQTLA